MIKIELELENGTLRRTVRTEFCRHKIRCFSYSRHQNVFDKKPFYKKPLDDMITRIMVIILIVFICLLCGMFSVSLWRSLHSHTTLTKCSNYKPYSIWNQCLAGRQGHPQRVQSNRAVFGLVQSGGQGVLIPAKGFWVRIPKHTAYLEQNETHSHTHFRV